MGANADSERPLGVTSLVIAYDALGLPTRVVSELPPDISPDALRAKITNPGILASLGVPPRFVAACWHAEMAANLLDAYAETGQRRFLREADTNYRTFLDAMPAELQAIMRLITSFAMPYFQLEQYVARRIARGDVFTAQEVIHYHYSRGGDSHVYAEIARHHDPRYAGLVAGFRARQALWDLSDEIRDVETDRQGLGANLLLMSPLGMPSRLRTLADSFREEALASPLPEPLIAAIEQEYATVRTLLG